MVCFIVLHYMTLTETISCVNYLRMLKQDKQIIIVDNCSPNGSGKQIKELYENDSDIDVLLNQKNVGFAAGNNLGCEFAKRTYNPDFYVVMNNDVEIHQDDFIEQIRKIWIETDFDILGPDVYCDTMAVHQSPKSLRRTSLEESIKLKKVYERKVNSRFIVPVRCFAKKIKVLNSFHRNKKEKSKGIDYTKRYKNVPLHGSCIVFAKRFMSGREYAFSPETFFYYESEILDYEAQLNGYKVLYAPEVQVIHHHNVSTNSVYKNELQKVRFMNEQNYLSISKFITKYGG